MNIFHKVFGGDCSTRAEALFLLRRIDTAMSELSDDIANLTATSDKLTVAVQAANARLAAVPQQIADAVAQALAAGATADQLKAITDVTAAVQADVDALAPPVAAAAP